MITLIRRGSYGLASIDRIDVPTLLVWGANDRLFPTEYAEEWRRLIPGATAVIVPECGHIPHVEKPAAFVFAFEGFIDGKRLAA